MPDLKIDAVRLHVRIASVAAPRGPWRHAGPSTLTLRSSYAGRFAPAISAWLCHAEPVRAKRGGGRRTRTFEVIRRLIYSQLPLPFGTLPRLNPIAACPLKWRREGHG